MAIEAVDSAAWLGLASELSLAEFLALPEDARCEIVDGVVRPMTRSDHKRRNIQSLLAEQLRRSAPNDLLVYEEEVVVLSEVPATGRIPDVAVIRPSTQHVWSNNSTPARDVLLVVEVISPSSVTVDRREKPPQYALGGIPAFWLVDASGEVTVTVHRLVGTGEQRHYEVSATFGPGETITDPALPWVAIDVEALGRYS